jgi:hypothetical protein
MAEFLVVFGVGLAARIEIVTGGLDAFVEALMPCL